MTDSARSAPAEHLDTPDDPDYFHIRGAPLTGLLNALSAPEQSWFRRVAHHGLNAPLLRDSLIRLALFALLVAVSGWAFLWYWIPLRLAYGASYFSFYYCLHRRGPEYGVYPLRPPPIVAHAFGLLFGNDALQATCHHIQHANPRIAARPIARLDSRCPAFARIFNDL